MLLAPRQPVNNVTWKKKKNENGLFFIKPDCVVMADDNPPLLGKGKDS